jgi:hypothetical protein
MKDECAGAFLNFARQYQRAADLVFAADRSLESPAYHLYMHSIELACKAFLRTRNIQIVGTKRAKGHNVEALYDECQGLGLSVGQADREVKSVAHYLEIGNRYQGFRYFTSESMVIPDLAWTRDVVDKLLGVVAHFVEDFEKQDPPSTAAVKVSICFGNPEPQFYKQ